MTNNYPVVFFVFKRPQTTYDFLRLMYEAGIKKIYVFADGPRNTVEMDLTNRVKAEINSFQETHQDVTLHTHFAKENIGLRQNIITGLNTVFKKEDAAIIIEDDCLPSDDFFRFTREMLSRYQNNKKIMSINGMSVGGDYGDYSYGFTKYPQCWGWATWKRAWVLYDPEMKNYNHDSWQTLARSISFGHVLTYYFELMFKLIQKGQIDTWDFQWTYAHFVNSGLAVSPVANLVSNIGFDSAATNTKTKSSVANLSTKILDTVLIHPNVVEENVSISRAIEKKFYTSPLAILGLLRQYYYYLVK